MKTRSAWLGTQVTSPEITSQNLPEAMQATSTGQNSIHRWTLAQAQAVVATPVSCALPFNLVICFSSAYSLPPFLMKVQPPAGLREGQIAKERWHEFVHEFVPSLF